MTDSVDPTRWSPTRFKRLRGLVAGLGSRFAQRLVQTAFVAAAVLTTTSGDADQTLADCAVAYPETSSLAIAAGSEIEAELAELRTRQSSSSVTAAIDGRLSLAAVLAEIADHHERTERMLADDQSRPEREIEAGRQLAAPAAEPALVADANWVSEQLAAGRERLTGLRARRIELLAESTGDLRRERDAAIRQLDEAVAAVVDDEAMACARAAADLRRELARSLIASFDERADFWRRELPVLDLEISVVKGRVGELERALAEGLERESQSLVEVGRDAWDAVSAARGAVEAATTPEVRAAATRRAAIAAVAAGSAELRVEQTRLELLPSAADAVAAAGRRMQELQRRFTLSRALGADLGPLLRRGRAVIEAQRRAQLAGGWTALRERRDQVAVELERTEATLLESDVVEDEGLGVAPVAADASGDLELERRWHHALRERADALRRLNDGYLDRLQRLQELDRLLRGEADWIERKSVIVRIPWRNPWRVCADAAVTLRAVVAGDGLRLVAGLGLVWLVAGVAVLGRLLWPRPKVGNGSARRLVAGDVAAVAACGLAALTAAWMTEDPIVGVAIVAPMGTVALWVLLAGLLRTITGRFEEVWGRYLRRVAAIPLAAAVVFDLPARFLAAVGTAGTQPDLLVWLGRGSRLGVAVAVAVVVVASHFEARRAASQASVRGRLAAFARAAAGVVLVFVGLLDLAGWAALASRVSAVIVGAGLTVALVAFLAVELRRLGRATEDVDPAGDDNELTLARRGFVGTQARLYGKLLVAGIAALGIGLSLGVRPADLAWSSLAAPLSAPIWVRILLGFALFAVAQLVMLSIRGLLDHYVLVWLGVDRGARYSITSVLHYAVILSAIAVIGFEVLGLRIEDMQWLLAAIGVGLGFGLQEVVSNFVSGIIILLERPLVVGDVVAFEGESGEVVNVSIRSTTVRTGDNHFIVVPNKDIITQRLVNFTGRDPLVRITVHIGVAYGSDVRLVERLLLEAAHSHPQVGRRPAPDVLFATHGESSLDFELRAWVHVRLRYDVQSDLRHVIDASFRAHGVSIPFPHREIVVRTAPPDVGSAQSPAAAGAQPLPFLPGLIALSAVGGVAAVAPHQATAQGPPDPSSPDSPPLRPAA